jgi:WD40 repeat protein
LINAQTGVRKIIINAKFTGAETTGPYGVSFSPDGSFIAAGKGNTAPGEIKLWQSLHEKKPRP